MFHFAETHGIEILITYYLLISVLGTMPPLPDNAGYYRKWLYAMAHTFCGNMRSVAASLSAKAGVKLPEESK